MTYMYYDIQQIIYTRFTILVPSNGFGCSLRKSKYLSARNMKGSVQAATIKDNGVSKT